MRPFGCAQAKAAESLQPAACSQSIGLVHHLCGAGAAVSPQKAGGQQAAGADPTSSMSIINLDL